MAFVIFASLYANIKSDWGAAEAADDTQVIRLLKRILEKLEGREMSVTIYNQSDAVRALPIATRTANTTVNGDTIDRADGSATVMFIVSAGTITDGSAAVTIQESDDASSWANAASSDIQGGPTLTFGTAQSSTVNELGYSGRKRYVRITHIQTGATAGGTMGASAVLFGGRKPNVR